MNSATTAISYTLVISSSLTPIAMIEGKPLHRRIKNQEEHKYLIEHPCNPSESIYVRISTKQNGGNLNRLMLKMGKIISMKENTNDEGLVSGWFS